MVNSWTIAEYQVMADMKKVYNDLIIINLYVLCFLLESYQNTECPSVEGLCHEGFEWYETGRYIGGTLAFLLSYPIICFWKQIKTWPFVTVGFWPYLYDIRKKSISFSFISHHHGSSKPRRTYGRFRILYRNSALRLLLLLSFTNTWAFLILASTLDRFILDWQWGWKYRLSSRL